MITIKSKLTGETLFTLVARRRTVFLSPQEVRNMIAAVGNSELDESIVANFGEYGSRSIGRMARAARANDNATRTERQNKETTFGELS